jgi:hypothetical protein
MTLQWKLVDLNTEGVQSSSLYVHEAMASWTVNGEPGRYRVREERRRIGGYDDVSVATGYAVTRITATGKGRGMDGFRGHSCSRRLRSVNEGKAIADRDNHERMRALGRSQSLSD